MYFASDQSEDAMKIIAPIVQGAFDYCRPSCVMNCAIKYPVPMNHSLNYKVPCK